MTPNRCLTPADVLRINQHAQAFRHANNPDCKDCARASPNGGACGMRSCIGFKPRGSHLSVVRTSPPSQKS